MYMGRNYSNKNLTELEIGNIEFYLNENKSPAEIARLLSKDPSGVRKEIKKYSSFFGNARKCSNCLNKDNCHEKYLCDKILDKIKCSKCKYCVQAVKICPNYKITIDCDLLKKNHHVCNGCELYLKCKKVKIKYHAQTAIKMHNAVQRVSRIDVKLDKFPQEFKDYLSSRIKQPCTITNHTFCYRSYCSNKVSCSPYMLSPIFLFYFRKFFLYHLRTSSF